MKITITEKDGLMIVALSGSFDTVASNQAECDLAPVFERNDCDVQIDFTETRYISSTGLRLLLNIYKHVSKNGHNMGITGVKPDSELYEALDLAGVFTLFNLKSQ